MAIDNHNEPFGGRPISVLVSGTLELAFSSEVHRQLTLLAKFKAVAMAFALI